MFASSKVQNRQAVRMWNLRIRSRTPRADWYWSHWRKPIELVRLEPSINLCELSQVKDVTKQRLASSLTGRIVAQHARGGLLGSRTKETRMKPVNLKASLVKQKQLFPTRKPRRAKKLPTSPTFPGRPGCWQLCGNLIPFDQSCPCLDAQPRKKPVKKRVKKTSWIPPK